MFELNGFLSLQVLPFLPFLFRSNLFFSCMSRDVNHAFCVVYKILGEVALCYRIYLLPGLMQPFSTAVLAEWLAVASVSTYENTQSGKRSTSPFSWTSRYVNHVIRLVTIQPWVRLSCFTGCFSPGLMTTSVAHIRGWLLFRLPDLLFSWPNHLLWGFIGPFFTVFFQCYIVKKTCDRGNLWHYLVSRD